MSRESRRDSESHGIPAPLPSPDYILESRVKKYYGGLLNNLVKLVILRSQNNFEPLIRYRDAKKLLHFAFWKEWMKNAHT